MSFQIIKNYELHIMFVLTIIVLKLEFSMMNNYI
jgi:hypothetical protein